VLASRAPRRAIGVYDARAARVNRIVTSERNSAILNTMRVFSAIAIFTMACGGGVDGGPDAGSSEPAELAGITAAHNTARAQVGDPPLTWDPALATIASSWVVQCIDTDGNGLVDHDAGRSDHYPEYVGENIYASSGTATGPDAVAAWIGEASDYDYASNTCAAGKVCGHYTQVVWKATTKLGCAIHDCTGLAYPSTIVCDYAPGGNDGGKPY
jgi:uncharacterized protein YkwD